MCGLLAHSFVHTAAPNRQVMYDVSAVYPGSVLRTSLTQLAGFDG